MRGKRAKNRTKPAKTANTCGNEPFAVDKALRRADGEGRVRHSEPA